jgi:hypothetical protein
MTPGQIANGTGYAFVPFLVALIVARFLTKSLRRTQNPQSLPNLGRPAFGVAPHKKTNNAPSLPDEP